MLRTIRWALVLLPLLLVSCAVSFVSSYDALTNEAIQAAAVKMETIFAKVTVSKIPYALVREDYRELDGQLAVVTMRAGNYGSKNKAERDVMRLLQAEVADLEIFHREVGPYRASQLAGARSILRSLLHHQKAKKAAVGEGGAR